MDSQKIEVLSKANQEDRLAMLRTMDVAELSEFLTNHREFCKEHHIHPFEITKALDGEKQKDFISRLEQCNLTLNEKREILASLRPEVKQGIDVTNLPREYATAIQIPTRYGGQVAFEIDRDFEEYRGLDNLITVSPEEFTPEQRKRFMEFCDICPNAEVMSSLKNVAYSSTSSEYKEAEEWISSVIDNIPSEYSQAQKIAIIDNAIGKKISHTPTDGTEAFEPQNSKALWKIISKGYGVCNGVARVEQYMLKRIGVESEMVSGHGHHGFLKLIDVELPLADGETVKGNTILDPTWNLARQRFGGMPDNFCMTYEQARKNDLTSLGLDSQAHKNDEKLQDATIGLDEQSLRNLYTSVGLADKEGMFPLKNLVEKSNAINESYPNNPEENLRHQFLALSQTCPEFATCQNSTISALKIILDFDELKANRCVVNRVFDKKDKDKNAVVYVYLDSKVSGKSFFFADKNKGQFVQLPQEEFINRFECYEKDLENWGGIRPWEDKPKEKDSLPTKEEQKGEEK